MLIKIARYNKISCESQHWNQLYSKISVKYKELHERMFFFERNEIDARDSKRRRIEIEEDFVRVKEINQRQNREIAQLMAQVRHGINFQNEARQIRLNETKLKAEIEQLKQDLKKKDSQQNNDDLLKMIKKLDEAQTEINALKEKEIILKQENSKLENERDLFCERFNAANIALENETLKVRLNIFIIKIIVLLR